ncbi:MAG: hypothetical protein HY905_11910 [Deltaproteobacteria bacterium]|nr:hypothetical protein [Deltaproteobacteria bacterium]
MSIPKRLVVVGVLLVAFLGSVGAASSGTDGAKASRSILNAAADILGVSSTDRENALAGRCGQISDGQFRLLCQNDCGNISDSDVRNLCKRDCGAISDSDLRRLCQGG